MKFNLRCFLNIFDKTQAILLYCTSTSREQIYGLCYLKCSAKFNELSLKFQKHQEVAEKWLKLK